VLVDFLATAVAFGTCDGVGVSILRVSLFSLTVPVETQLIVIKTVEMVIK